MPMAPETLTTGDFARFAAAVGLPAASVDLWRDTWAESQASFCESGLFFLQHDFVRCWCDHLRLGSPLPAVLLAAAESLAGSPVVQRLAWHCYRLMYLHPGMLAARVHEWPMLPQSICPQVELFYAFLFLAGLPALETRYASRGIPGSVLRDTLADLELWIRDYHRRNGRWGLGEHRWLIQHLSARVFQLGRLQFQFGTYRYGYTAYRERESAQVVVFPADALPLQEEGYIAAESETRTGKTSFTETGELIHGTPVLPCGCISPSVIALPRSRWRQILQQGDPVLNIHIPAGGPMSHAACGDAFGRARAFFAAHFPEYRCAAFACTSWLLDPQLAQYLEPSSNLLQFQQEVYLVPVPGTDGSQTIARVFGGPITDLSQAPRQTSLQRAVLDHLEKGKHWRQGACLLFPEDLDWGQAVYRRGTRALRPRPNTMRKPDLQAPDTKKPSETNQQHPPRATGTYMQPCD